MNPADLLDALNRAIKSALGGLTALSSSSSLSVNLGTLGTHIGAAIAHAAGGAAGLSKAISSGIAKGLLAQYNVYEAIAKGIAAGIKALPGLMASLGPFVVRGIATLVQSSGGIGLIATVLSRKMGQAFRTGLGAVGAATSGQGLGRVGRAIGQLVGGLGHLGAYVAQVATGSQKLGRALSGAATIGGVTLSRALSATATVAGSTAAGLAQLAGIVAQTIPTLRDFAQHTVHASRRLAAYNSQIAQAVAMDSFQRILRQIDLANRTQNLSSGLISAVNRMQERLQPLSILQQNLTAAIGQVFAGFIGRLADLIAPIAEVLNRMFEQIPPNFYEEVGRALADGMFFIKQIIALISAILQQFGVDLPPVEANRPARQQQAMQLAPMFRDPNLFGPLRPPQPIRW
ncbi:MAG: hypothetical protein IRY99_09295 [Isosphaeraceae bacterium]|nr:hypothetical protein [Isosphaeraceae bacterium]